MTDRVKLAVDVEQALVAVAAVDGTDPSVLATGVIRWWLIENADRFRAAVAALDALDPVDEPDKPDPPPASKSHTTIACDHAGCEFVAASPHGLGIHRARTHRSPKKKAKRPAAGASPQVEGDARLPAGRCGVCSGTDGRHASWCASAPRPSQVPDTRAEPAEPCDGCGKPATKTVDGVPCCMACWREAGRPAA